MYLPDTNVVSELRNPRTADRAVVAWSRSLHNGDWLISAVTIMMLRTWLTDRTLPEFAGRIIPLDTEVAIRCAPMHVPDPKPERDSMIAATALVHGLTVATRNVADFQACGAPVCNPWLHGS